MASSRRTSDEAAFSVLSQLNQTQALIQTLLQEIRVSSSEQASLKSELKQLRHSVSILSNIIRGGDGHHKPLLSEVEVLKHADHHLDKRITTVSDVLDREIDEIADALSKQFDNLRKQFFDSEKRLDERIKASEQAKKEHQALVMQLQHENVKDVRLDRRQRLQILSTIVIALLSLVASAITLISK